jgi:hypothetical protein
MAALLFSFPFFGTFYLEWSFYHVCNVTDDMGDHSGFAEKDNP